MHMFVIKELHVLNFNNTNFVCTTLHIMLIYYSLCFLSLSPFLISFSLSPSFIKRGFLSFKGSNMSEADPPYYQSIVRMYLKHLSSLFTDALVSLCMVNTCTCVAVKNINI